MWRHITTINESNARSAPTASAQADIVDLPRRSRLSSGYLPEPLISSIQGISIKSEGGWHGLGAYVHRERGRGSEARRVPGHRAR